MSKHTPEPWTADIRTGCAAAYPMNQAEYAQGLHPTAHGRDIAVWMSGESYSNGFEYMCISEKQAANLRRIVACVNACTGMADPQAEIAMLRNYVGNNYLRSDYQNADQMRSEIAMLREAVRVLGAELFKSERWKYAEMGGSLRRFDEDPVACTDESIRNNPIAAAAVRGEVKE